MLDFTVQRTCQETWKLKVEICSENNHTGFGLESVDCSNKDISWNLYCLPISLTFLPNLQHINAHIRIYMYMMHIR